MTRNQNYEIYSGKTRLTLPYVDIFSFDKKVGCYETNKISFNEIYNLENLKKLNRFNKIENNAHFFINPVRSIKKINVNNLFELIKDKIKEI